MTGFKSILVATDFSPDANNAMRRAALLAEQHGARLTMLHVVDPAGSQTLRRWFSPTIDIELKTMQTRATLRRFAKEIIGRHGVTARFEVVAGDAFEEIHSRSGRADLVVLGQRGSAGSVKQFFVGSTVERLLRLARKPVLVVKRGHVTPYRQLLVPVDFTDKSETSLAAAARLARDAALNVFHVRDVEDEFEMKMAEVPLVAIREFRDMKSGESRARIAELAARAGVHERRLFAHVAQGDPARMPLEQEALLRADLVVAGKQGRSAMAEFLLGSVSRRLLEGSTCDVLIVPSAAEDLRRGRPAAKNGPGHGQAHFA
jgi:nucleotide-binding universal stress UspA family protein